MNANEYGVIFRLNAKYNMSGSTSLKLTFTDPDDVVKEITTGVTAPAAQATGTQDGIEYTFEASEYFQYTLQSGDIDKPGQWRVRGDYIDGTKNLKTDIITFTVAA